MKIERPAAAFADHRGQIVDIITMGDLDGVTLITSVRGAVRGNHFHKLTTQWVYVLSGRIRIAYQVSGEPVRTATLEPGDLAMNPPGESHAMEALDDSTFIVVSKGPRSGAGYEDDTYRLTEPLLPRSV